LTDVTQTSNVLTPTFQLPASTRGTNYAPAPLNVSKKKKNKTEQRNETYQLMDEKVYGTKGIKRWRESEKVTKN
jgi:hypothetical protein